MKRDITLYLQDIIDAVQSIFSFVKNLDYESFKDDDKTLSAVIRKLEIIGEAAKNIPDNIVDNNPEVPWSYMAKTRDRLIHGYFDSDPEIIWKTIYEDLTDIPQEIEKIIIKLNNS